MKTNSTAMWEAAQMNRWDLDTAQRMIECDHNNAIKDYERDRIAHTLSIELGTRAAWVMNIENKHCFW